MSQLHVYYGRIFLKSDEIPGQIALMARHPIREAVEKASPVSRYGHQWILADLEFHDGDRKITGRLGHPGSEVVTRHEHDPSTNKFVDKEIALPAAVSAPFAMDYGTGLIAFERIPNMIRARSFMGHLVAILNESEVGDFTGELVRTADNYRDFLKTVDKVKAVSFEVRPTNPRDRVIFAPLDRGLKDANGKVQRVHIENREDGLTLNPPPSRDLPTENPAIQGIEMVDEGYGVGKGYIIDAEKDGHPQRYRHQGGSLLNDAFDDVPASFSHRTAALMDALDSRAEFAENEAASPLAMDDFDIYDDDEAESEGQEEAPPTDEADQP